MRAACGARTRCTRCLPATLACVGKIYHLMQQETNQTLPEGSVRFPALDKHSELASKPPDLNPDKIIYLAFTSGTTGVPKGVLHSDNTLLANGRAMIRDWHH